MFTMETTILVGQWPRVQIIVKLPTGQVLTETCMYDIALSQFEAKVKSGLQLMMNGIMQQYAPKHPK